MSLRLFSEISCAAQRMDSKPIKNSRLSLLKPDCSPEIPSYNTQIPFCFAGRCQVLHSTRNFTSLFCLFMIAVHLAPSRSDAAVVDPGSTFPTVQADDLDKSDEEVDEEADELTERQGYLVQIDLPFTLQQAQRVEQALALLVKNAPKGVDPKKRSVIILQFDTASGSTGQGSDFHAASSLASYLASREFDQVKKIAYIPPLRGGGGAAFQDAPASRLMGHAVLIALACEEIVIDETASMGKAGIDCENGISPPMKATYDFVAAHREPIPLPFAASMLDPAKTLYKVVTAEGTEYLDQEGLDAKRGAAIERDPLTRPGSLPLYTAEQLAAASINCHKVSSRIQVADRYGIPLSVLEGNPTQGIEIKAVRVELPAFVDGRTVDWSLRALDSKLADKETNMVVLDLDCEGGDLESCLQFARYLVALRQDDVRTVAHVSDQVRGPPALIALACDDLLMSPTALVGGVYEPSYTPEEFGEIQPTIEELAKEAEKPWTLFTAVLDNRLQMKRYRRKGSTLKRIYCKQEFKSLGDKKLWIDEGPFEMFEGLNGDRALNLSVARKLVDSADQLQTYYHIDQSPQILKPTKTDKAIEGFAQFLASPIISMWLLFGAMVLISTEMSSPGLSIPGFLGTLCLILFFWSQYLDGNAHWLEIVLFVAGVLFIILEIFVIPGLGIFGIGGMLMVICSIVLATQTFIIPRTAEEMARMPVSLGILVAACSGFLVAAAVMRKVIPNTPYFKKMMLEPRVLDQMEADREAIVDWSELMGKAGTTVTRLVPAGKARIAGKVVDVITDGRMVDKDEPIKVIEAIGNRVVVAPKTVK